MNIASMSREELLDKARRIMARIQSPQYKEQFSNCIKSNRSDSLKLIYAMNALMIQVFNDELGGEVNYPDGYGTLFKRMDEFEEDPDFRALLRESNEFIQLVLRDALCLVSVHYTQKTVTRLK
ncbi:hypothetical protein ACOME3_006021 [Neoechinorhynchus agilis]